MNPISRFYRYIRTLIFGVWLYFLLFCVFLYDRGGPGKGK